MDPLLGRKILLVITKSNWGGAQAYVYSLATSLKRDGYDVSVALGGTGLPGTAPGILAERLKEANVPVIVLSSFARDISLFRDVRAFFELLTLIRKQRPHILHLNSSKVGGIGALAGRLTGVPRIVFTSHGWAHMEPRPWFMRTFIRISSWLTVCLSTAVIVLSKADYRNAPVLFSRKKLFVVHNGIGDFTLLPRDEARAELTKRYSMPAASTWILMQAELHKNKDIPTAIEAFASIAEKFKDAILVVMGEGEERKKLEACITKYGLQQRISLVGFVPGSRSYLLAGDIFLMTSRKEGLPMALLEAGYAGLPVISTSVGGIPELIEDKKDGLLFAPGNVPTLTQSLMELLGSPALAQRYAGELKIKVRTEFSEQRMIRNTIGVYTN